MLILFYLTALIAIGTTLLVITRQNPVHALVYLVVSLLSVALLFFLLGAPFAAALEVIVYAGAIMMLFVFVMMMLNVGQRTKKAKQTWVGPFICTAILFIELLWVLVQADGTAHSSGIPPQEVSMAMFGPYALGVEMAAFLLLAGLAGAHHLGKEEQ
jgi:NADH-quinone oxidoreductase subunit J